MLGVGPIYGPLLKEILEVSLSPAIIYLDIFCCCYRQHSVIFCVHCDIFLKESLSKRVAHARLWNNHTKGRNVAVKMANFDVFCYDLEKALSRLFFAYPLFPLVIHLDLQF